MNKEKNTAEIKSIDELLKMGLNIPNYQRPYKWKIHNIQDLLNDIENAIADSEKYTSSFKYRIGTIILHQNEADKYDIVDGQQRIISLVLLKKCLDPEYKCDIFGIEFNSKISRINIHDNYTFIREWFSLKTAEKKEAFNNAFSDILEVVVICVGELSEAFQLFDSQNTRGKALDPHDLLKAYHLREMRKYPYEMEHAVTKWEAKDTKLIRELFDLYLFPIQNWSRKNKSKTFTAQDIDTYKGIAEGSTYSYAKRVCKAMPCFQITEPFIAGNDFFEMVDHYIYLLQDIKAEIETNEVFKDINEVINERKNSVGFGYAKNLFYCALLCYYDKFHNFDEMSVKKLFIWAFMIRVDMKNLGFDTINKYAIGDENEKYTNTIAMFSKISLARLHIEISSLQIKTRESKDEQWEWLYKKMEEILRFTEVSNE